MRRIAFALAGLLLSSFTAEACSYTRGPFLRLLDKWGQTCGHPLCGRIIRTGPPVTLKEKPECSSDSWMAMREDIQSAVVKGGAVLFGEVHDNAEQHELQSRIALGTFASFVLEQVRTDQFAALDKIKEVRSRGYDNASLPDILSALEWDKSGWSKYNYEPLLRGILLARQAVYAGDASRETMTSVVRDGHTAITETELKAFKLDTPLDPKLEEAAKSEISAAHCGATASGASLDNMSFAQRYRDAHMADAITKALEKHSSVAMFAGNTHVRNDRGVPWYLRQRAPDKKITTIMFVEVEKDKTDADAYVPRDPGGQPAVDYVILTPPGGQRPKCD